MGGVQCQGPGSCQELGQISVTEDTQSETFHCLSLMVPACPMMPGHLFCALTLSHPTQLDTLG